MSKISLSTFQAQEKAAERQRRATSITSLVVALMVVALLMLILALVLLPSWTKDDTVMVSYQMPVSKDEELQKKTFSQVQTKPSAPSSAMTKVIAANTSSPVAIPVPDVEFTEPSLDFGSGDDFGAGWGNGSGDGTGGGGTTFFNQKVSAERVVYVIDYSGSMSGEREKLMRKELTKSVGQVKLGMQFQMIFFAGPAWVAGNDVSMAKDRKTAEVSDQRKKFKWRGQGAHKWEVAGRSQEVEWIPASPSNREEALKLIKNTKLVWGTNWENPLEMAIEMEPPPQTILFMTDGSIAGDMVELAKRLGRRAKSKGITINTVAMMQPKAEDAMKELAKRTGGQFSIVDKGGKVRVGR
ncbi:vWA domain-containing protein [Haloferula sp.]|uniref:vWA domain-containing protein n=1 Tax=Haloferula sp. TaxID=2497595 RepID=UPI003C75B35A